MQFTIILPAFATLFCVSVSETKLGENTEMSHKLVKRQCSCRPSSCNCSPVIVTLQISCSCPQICTCPSTISPTYPPVTHTIPVPVTTILPPVTYTLPPPVTYTLPPPVTYTLPPPVTYTLPPVTQAPIAPTQSPYCCILFICAMCGSGSGYKELSSSYRPSPPSSIQYQSVPDYQHPSQPSTYHYPTSSYIRPGSDDYKSSFPSQYPLLPSPSSTSSLSALSSAPQQTPYAYPASGSKCSIGFAICFGGSFCCRNIS